MNFFRQELLEDAIQNNRPFPTWDGATVVAWLEVCIERNIIRTEKIIVSLRVKYII